MKIIWDHCKLIYAGLSEIYLDTYDPTVCYKKISKTQLPAPHNSQKELEILQRLQNNDHIIELLDFVDDETTDKIDPFFVFKFKYYQDSLDNYVLQFWESKSSTTIHGEQHDRPKRKKFSFVDGQINFTSPSECGNAKPLADSHIFLNGMTESLATQLFYQLVDGLEFIHSHKIIHRDIKPQNVLVDEKGVIKIIDFDVSFDVLHGNSTGEPDFDKKITDVSTSIYKAPELLFGIGNYDYKVDIWSLMILVQHFALKEFASPDNSVKLSHLRLPCTIDNGMEINYNKNHVIDGGSDIRLITSIFDNFGIPSIEKWPSVAHHGSSTFKYMFAPDGKSDYMANINYDKLFPMFSSALVQDCIVPMCHIEQTDRISSKDLKARLKLHI